jgi:hypothetical protein
MDTHLAKNKFMLQTAHIFYSFIYFLGATNSQEIIKEGPPGGRKKVQNEELHLFVCLFVCCVFLQNVGLFSSLQHEATLEARDSPSY